MTPTKLDAFPCDTCGGRGCADCRDEDDPRGDPPIARNSDPWTSHAAAREFVEGGRRNTTQKRIVDMMYSMWGRGSVGRKLTGVHESESHTSSEIGREAQVPTAHKRLPELERKGLVVRGEPRVCSVTGAKATTWRLK